MYENRIYYDDQSAWGAGDWNRLWVDLHRLCQFVGPTKMLVEALKQYDQLPPNRQRSVDRVATIQRNRAGRRYEELAALDLPRMSHATRYLLKHLLVRQGRYELALERFENMRDLEEVGLDHEPVATPTTEIVCHCYAGHGIRM